MTADDRATAGHLAVTDVLLAPVNRAAIGALGPAGGSRGLDAGCGVGLQAILLGQAVGLGGEVVGVDLSPALIAEARVQAGAAGLSGRPRGSRRAGPPFRRGRVRLGVERQLRGLRRAGPRGGRRRVGPGGAGRRAGGLAGLVLPDPLAGAPPARGAAQCHRAGAGALPAGHARRAAPPARPRPAAAGGPGERPGRTFGGEAHAPLAGPVRAALAALVAMRWPGAEQELSAADGGELRRLCDPGSADFIVDHPAYCACFTETLFWGRVDDGRPRKHAPAGTPDEAALA